MRRAPIWTCCLGLLAASCAAPPTPDFPSLDAFERAKLSADTVWAELLWADVDALPPRDIQLYPATPQILASLLSPGLRFESCGVPVFAMGHLGAELCLAMHEPPVEVQIGPPGGEYQHFLATSALSFRTVPGRAEISVEHEFAPEFKVADAPGPSVMLRFEASLPWPLPGTQLIVLPLSATPERGPRTRLVFFTAYGAPPPLTAAAEPDRDGSSDPRPRASRPPEPWDLYSVSSIAIAGDDPGTATVTLDARGDGRLFVGCVGSELDGYTIVEIHGLAHPSGPCIVLRGPRGEIAWALPRPARGR